MFKNILVASDGSKCGDKAVDLAIDLASKYGAKISALYVMDFALDFSYDDLDDAGGAVLDDITAKGKGCCSSRAYHHCRSNSGYGNYD